MGRGRLELREDDAHDGSPLVPSADIRLADAGCKGLLQLASRISRVGLHQAGDVKPHQHQGPHRSLRTLLLEVEHLVELRFLVEVLASPEDIFRRPAIGYQP